MFNHFSYRTKDFKDPPYEPTKLFRVERIKPMKGLPYWEKKILEEFKLGGLVNCDYFLFLKLKIVDFRK